jgi:NADP-dependent 3-hydroxy acid dehydrogenase YdfG
METANIANVKQPFDLTGRIAIATGGSVGLGGQIAEGLAETGANLETVQPKSGDVKCPVRFRISE